MNSFRFLERGVDAEIARQEAILRERRRGDAGDAPLRPPQRRAQLAALEGGGARLPLLPRARPGAGRADRGDARARPRGAARAAGRSAPSGFERELGLPAGQAQLLAFRAELGDFFEEAVAADGVDPRALANWVTGELLARLGDGDPAGLEARAGGAGEAGGDGRARGRSPARPPRRCSATLVAEGGDPAAIVEARGPRQGRRATSWRAIVDRAMAEQADAVEKIRAGNDKAIGAIVGAVMKETKGRADGGEVQRLIRERLWGGRNAVSHSTMSAIERERKRLPWASARFGKAARPHGRAPPAPARPSSSTAVGVYSEYRDQHSVGKLGAGRTNVLIGVTDRRLFVIGHDAEAAALLDHHAVEWAESDGVQRRPGQEAEHRA